MTICKGSNGLHVLEFVVTAYGVSYYKCLVQGCGAVETEYEEHHGG